VTAPQHWRKIAFNGTPALVPSDDETTEWLKRIKSGSVVAMDPNQIRNADRSALFWVLAGIVAENHEELTDKDAVASFLKTRTGYVRVFTVTLPADPETSAPETTVTIRDPKSIAFANMPEDEFVRFFDQALRVITSELMPGVDIDALRKEAYSRAGIGNYPETHSR
jgi:hypothetical protein